MKALAKALAGLTNEQMKTLYKVAYSHSTAKRYHQYHRQQPERNVRSVCKKKLTRG